MLAALQLYDRSDKIPVRPSRLRVFSNDMLGTRRDVILRFGHSRICSEEHAQRLHSRMRQSGRAQQLWVDKLYPRPGILKDTTTTRLQKNEQALKDLEASVFPQPRREGRRHPRRFIALLQEHTASLSHYSDVIRL